MFGRKGSQAEQAAPAATPAAQATKSTGGKGRPTPTRRAAEQRNRRPIVAGARAPEVKSNATKAERKAAMDARREVMRADRARTRQAMLDGDERFYLERDQGPARKWARNYVDARYNIGEYFIFFTVGFLILSTIKAIANLQVILVFVLYGGGLALAADLWLLRRKVVAECTKRFGAVAARGVGMYAIQRSLNIRRLRMPRPQVRRGEYPQ